MVRINYYGKIFSSKKLCTNYFNLSYSAVMKQEYKGLTFNESLDVQLISRLFDINVRKILLNKLYHKKEYLNTVQEYVKNLEKPIIEPKKKLRKRLNTYGIGFLYNGVFYSSVREYCEKYNISYNRLMKYKSRHHCNPQDAIIALQRIDKEHDELLIQEQFYISSVTYKNLIRKYKSKFTYYVNALVKENLQDKFKNVRLATFIKLAILKNIGNTREELENILKFIIKNNLQDKNIYNMTLYNYDKYTCTSLRTLCEKLNISYNTIRQLMRTEGMSYKGAIEYLLKKKKEYSYNGKGFISFTKLCKEFNVPYETAMKMHFRYKITKMEAFYRLIK